MTQIEQTISFLMPISQGRSDGFPALLKIFKSLGLLYGKIFGVNFPKVIEMCKENSMKREIISCMPSKLQALLSNLKEYPLYPGRTLRPDTYFASHVYFWFAALLSPLDFFSRLSKGRKMSANAGWDVPDDDGFYVADMQDFKPAQRCRSFCKKVIHSVDFEELATQSKKPFLVPYDLDQSDPTNLPVTEFALHPKILGTVSRYIGSMPVLLKSSIWYSNGEDVGGRSQLFHLDGEDVRTIKLLFLLEDVDALTRPFTVVSAKQSKRAYNYFKSIGKIKARNEKISDEVFFSFTNQSSIVPLTGVAGTVAFVDPTRCYHYGSRKGTKPRWLLMLHYQSAFSSDLPVLGKRVRAPRLVSEVFDNDVSASVLGYTHQHIIEVKRARISSKV